MAAYGDGPERFQLRVQVQPTLVFSADKEDVYHYNAGEDTEDYKKVFEILKEIDLLQKWFDQADMKYVHLTKITPDLNLECYTINVSGFECFKESVENGKFQKVLADFLDSCGVEAALGLTGGSKERRFQARILWKTEDVPEDAAGIFRGKGTDSSSHHHIPDTEKEDQEQPGRKKQDRNVEFILHIPSEDKPLSVKIMLSGSNKKYLLEPDDVCRSIWTGILVMTPEMFKTSNGLFKVQVTLPGWFGTEFFKVKSETVWKRMPSNAETIYFAFKDGGFNCDFVVYATLRCQGDIRNALMMIDELADQVGCPSIMQIFHLFHHCDQNVFWSTLLIYLFGKSLSVSHSSILGMPIPKEIPEVLVSALKHLLEENIPKSVLDVILRGAYELVMLAHRADNKACLFVFMDYVLPFSPCEDVLKFVVQLERERGSLQAINEHVLVKTEGVDLVCRVARRLFSHQGNQEYIQFASGLVLRLMKTAPLGMLVKLMPCLDELKEYLNDKDIQDEFESRVSVHLKHAVADGNFQLLLETCEYLIPISARPFAGINVCEKVDIEDVLIRMLSKVTSSRVDVTTIEQIMTLRNVWQKPDVLMSLLQVLCTSRNNDLQKLFIKCAKTKNKMVHKMKGFDVMVEKWFEIATNALPTSYRRKLSNDTLLKVYELLNDISLVYEDIQTDTVRNLGSKVEQYWKAVNIADFVQHFVKNEETIFFHPTTEEIFREHFRRAIFNADPNHRHQLIRTLGSQQRGTLYLMRRCSAEALKQVIEVSGILKNEDDREKTFIFILKDFSFWKLILKVQGSYAQIVKKSEAYEVLLTTLSRVSEDFMKLLVTFSFLDALKKEHLEIDEAVAFMLEKVTPESARKKKREAEDLRMKTERELQTVMTMLSELVKRFGTAIYDAKKALDQAKQISDMLQMGKITVADLKSPQFLAEFHGMIPFIQNIHDLTASSVFWAVNHELVHETVQRYLDTCHATQTDHNDDVMSAETASYEKMASADAEDIAEDSISHLFDDASLDDDEDSERSQYGFPCVTFTLEQLSERGFKNFQEIWEMAFKPEPPLLTNVRVIFEADTFIEEVRIASKIVRRKPPHYLTPAHEMITHFPLYDEQIKCLFHLLKIMSENPSQDAEFQHVKECVDKLRSGTASDSLTLSELSDARTTVSFLEKLMDPNMSNIVEVIAGNSTLIDFLRNIMDDDVRFLIDAVEENSEQSLQESTVSALIDVKTFLLPVLKLPPDERSVRKILESMKKAISDGKAENIPEKMADCVNNLHGLKSLFGSIANRGEMTKHIVKNMMQSNTKLTFELKRDDCCQVMAAYKAKGVAKKLSHEDLADLRSRALLLVNKETSSVRDKKSREHFLEFIEFADAAFDVACVYEKLSSSGHPFYSAHKTHGPVSKDKVKETLEKCERELSDWEDTLMECRLQHSSLNFYYPEQLWEMKQYFEKGDKEGSLVHLLKFAGYGGNILPKLREFFSKAKCQMLKMDLELHSPLSESVQVLYLIGRTLDTVLPNFSSTVRELPVDEKRVSSVHVSSSVQRGQLFVTALTETSSMLIPTFLALYRNTTGCLPLPYQVLFCQEDTTMHEIDLFLLRFKGHEASSNHLFCIASVERLENEVQFHLVDALKKIPFSEVLSSLTVICVGSNHPIVDHFAACVHQMQPLTGEELQLCLHKLLPDVHTVTSDLPGQGKTEWAKKNALQRKRRIMTLHISGDASIADILVHLQNLALTETDVLHIDASIVSRPADLDLVLFRLVVLGFLAHHSVTYFLPTSCVLIEVANTINHTLRNSLLVCMSFRREHLSWKDFQDFVISQEVCSSVQVVCHYLLSLRDNNTDVVDLYFAGHKKVVCLPDDTCRKLLRETFSAASDLSHTVVNTFLHVLADQLKKLSCSYYFRTSNITDMLGKEFFPIKSTLVKALIDVSKEFSNRSVQTCRADQAKMLSRDEEEDASSIEGASATCATASAMVKRVSTMIQWSESNHLILVFHNKDVQTLSALYCSLQKVPNHIKQLFQTQGKPLQEIHSLQQKELQHMLLKIARYTPGEKDAQSLFQMAEGYALTPDNVLKMVLIVERVKAHIPVIIMGETGCGKTSLVRYLSQVCDIQFEVQNVHAGIGEADIVDKVKEVNEKALEKLFAAKKSALADPVWLFFDEINTCNHMGLLNDIVCHHMLQGTCLAPNLIIMAACNPYKLRNVKTIHSAGLQSKVKTDELSKLVYRVNPLPESMVDYVWDYGTLSEADEKSYIERMVHGVASPANTSMLVDLLAMSQKFVKEVEHSDSCVSLRDVNRCRILIAWFKKTLAKKGGYSGGEVDAVVLALAHCYHCRLSDRMDRKRYREAMTRIFTNHKTKRIQTQKDILEIISQEQSDLLDRMDLPDGTAKNSALKENVFVMFVCIMNCIPVFVVGKPGCSKSLSLQLIKGNLRGKDSRDPFFQTLPQLFCVSYQGSEASTSDGILKVFQKAQRYLKSDTHDHVLPVVVLDEIGLAEISRFNPLKVLHNLLEPPGRDFPEVAVVGISNWSLDAAKMNRAIHLSRTDMDADELYDTAVAISEATVTTESSFNPLLSKEGKKTPKNKINKSLLEAIAQAYHQYVNTQRFSNFHGLRDFYSLVKYVTKEMNCHHAADDLSMQIIVRGLLRNFGGLPSEKESLLNAFKAFVKKSAYSPQDEPDSVSIPVPELVKENVEDRQARHLMLITRGDIALYMIDDILQSTNREKVIILGSKFEEDLTDDYNYRILSKVILCMEQGVVLVLKDLDGIYGSLYDMLNQNYTTVGRGELQKQSCRVALGAYSNPLCQVHREFRCIVLVEHTKLDMSDPPFLNRFEKQQLHLSDVQSEDNLQLVENLDTWLQGISAIPGHNFGVHDLVPVYSSDFVPSLVLYLQQMNMDQQQMYSEAKKLLMPLCTPEAIVRTNRCKTAEFDENEYWSLPCHDGLTAHLNYLLQSESEKEKTLFKSIVLTHSSIHSHVSDLMKPLGATVQVEKLGAFKSEKQLTSRLKSFWEDSCSEWIVIQCSSSDDMDNFLLLKSLLDQEIEHHLHSAKANQSNKKYCLILIHLSRREEPESLSLINFLCGWHLALVDLLEPQSISLLDILETPFMELVSRMKPLKSFIQTNLFWAFACIDYMNGTRDMTQFHSLLSCISEQQEVVEFLEESILRFLHESDSMDTSSEWQTNVACNGGLLQKHLSLHTALMNEVQRCMKHPLAALVYSIERVNGWDMLLSISEENSLKLKAWLEIITKEKLSEVSDILSPTRPECYPCAEPIYTLRHPFSKLFIERIDQVKDVFMDGVRSKVMEEENDELPVEDFLDLCTLHQDQVMEEAGPWLFENQYADQFEDYFTDFCCIKSGRLALVTSQRDRTEILKKAVTPLISGDCSFPLYVTQLHAVYWIFGSDLEAQLQLIDACSRMTSQIKIQQILEECLKEESLDEKDTEDGEKCQFKPTSGLTTLKTSVSSEEGNDSSSPDNPEQDTESSSENIDSLKMSSVANVEDISVSVEESHVEEDSLPIMKTTEVVPELETNELANADNVGFHEKDAEKPLSGNTDEPLTEGGHVECEVAAAGAELEEVSQVADTDKASFCVKELLKAGQAIPVETDAKISKVEEKSVHEMESTDLHPPEMTVGTTHQEHVEFETNSAVTKQLIMTKKKDLLKPLSGKLVESTCVKLTPSPESVKHVGSLEIWQQNISLILSLAAEVSLEPDALQCLRFCNDFTSCLMLPYKQNIQLLGMLGGKLECHPMDDENVYNFVRKILEETKDVLERESQCIMSYYVTSCLINNPDTEALQWFLKDLTSQTHCELMLIGPALHLALDMELDVGDEKQQLAMIVNIMRTGIIPDDLPFMTFFDELMTTLGQGVHDHSLPSILIDIFQHYYFKDVVLNQQTQESQELVELMLESHRVLASPGFSMQHIVAIAFLKAALQSFGATLVKTSMKFGNKSVLQKLDSMLTLTGMDQSTEKRIKSLQNFFLRTILQGGGLKAILPFIETHGNIFAHLKSLNSEELAKKPCSDRRVISGSSSVSKEICKLMDDLPKNKPEMENWIKSKRTQPRIIDLFFCQVAEKFFLLRGFRSLTDSEVMQAKVLCELTSRLLPGNQDKLMQHMCSLKDMHVEFLQLTSESRDQQYQIVSVLVHLMCHIVGLNANQGKVNVKARIWQKLVENPRMTTELFLPGHNREGIPAGIFDFSGLEIFMTECDCGYRSFQKGSKLEERCVACNEFAQEAQILVDDHPAAETMEPDHIDFSVGTLSPVAYRVLQLFVHACLLSSIALGYSEPSSLQEMLLKPPDDVVPWLCEHICVQWKYLKQLMSLGDGQLRQFLHAVISSEAIDLGVDATQFKTSNERRSFEEKFDRNLMNCVSERFDLILQRVSAEQTEGEGNWDAYLAEVSPKSEDVMQGLMPRAFRGTVPPSVENMKHEFLLNRELRKDYPLLALVVAMEEELKLLQNLWILIHWHFCCVKYASFKLKKMDCQEMTVSKFIQKMNDSSQRNIVQRAFNDLKSSWNALREHEVCLKKYNKMLPSLQPLHQECKLEHCIIIGQNSGLEELIRSLVNMHNAYLLTAVKLSLQGRSPTISFLRSSGFQSNDLCLLPHVNLENASAKQIIHFHLNPKLLRFSQPDCRVGHGQLVHYDFYQIELEIANETLISKPHLSNKISSRIEFIGEAFLRPAALLGTINKLVPQEPLDREVKNSIDEFKKKSPASLSELLNFIEMMLCLLKRTHGDKNMSAYEYMSKWKFLASVSTDSIEGFLLKVSLRHSVAIYEYVESILADMIIENRDGSLPENLLSYMNGALENASSKDLEILNLALKRFAYRALTVPKSELVEPLTQYLGEPSLWSEKDMVGRNLEDLLALLPPDAYIDHVQQLVQVIRTTIEERKKSTDFSWMMSTPSAPDKSPSPATTAGQRKKTARKWRKK